MLRRLFKSIKNLFINVDKLKYMVDSLDIVNAKGTKNYQGSHLPKPPTRTPKQIIVHYTAGEINGMGHVIDWINNPKSKVSYHYIIGYDGTIHQLVDDKFIAWHAGSTSTPGYNENKLSLGVALESHPHDYTPKYTKKQQLSCTLLLAYLCKKWDIPAVYPPWGWEYHKGDADWNTYHGIMGHESVNKRKGDPGEDFPYVKIIKRVAELVKG